MTEPQPESRPEPGSEDMAIPGDPCLTPQPSDSTLILEPSALTPPPCPASDAPDQTTRIALSPNESHREVPEDPIMETALSIAATDEDNLPEFAAPIKPLSAASTQPIPILGSNAEISPLEAQPVEPAPSKGLPAWIWAIAGAGFAVALGVAGWFIWGPGLAPFHSNEDESSAPAEVERQPTTSPRESPVASSSPTQDASTSSTSTEVPTELRAYFDKATQGDPKAMHMLAVMYYNGLNVRQNREEGLKWYRKAAEAGSQGAQKELKQIESLQK